MDDAEFSKHFDVETDEQFKNDGFSQSLAQWIVGFIECYPDLVDKRVVNNTEIWTLKIKV